jgi:hypothetical protein
MSETTTPRYDWKSDEWFAYVTELGRQLPERPGATALVQYYVTDSPVGTFTFYDDIRDGRAHRVARGVVEAPDVEITIRFADFKRLITQKINSEHVERAVTGDAEKLARVAELHHQHEYQAMREKYLDVVAWSDDEQDA